jgi:hypothetical protein
MLILNDFDGMVDPTKWIKKVIGDRWMKILLDKQVNLWNQLVHYHESE